MFQEELDIMMESLREYEEHVSMFPESLLARIYGIF
jgi:hypothetical protein